MPPSPPPLLSLAQEAKMTSLLLPFASQWARSVGFVDNRDGTWSRQSETISTLELIRRYQASVK